MWCWRTCCDNDDSDSLLYYNKNSAFVSCEHHRQHYYSSRSYIPWTWSRKFEKTYRLGKVLGTGAYSVVHEATKIIKTPDTTNNDYAVKVIQRCRLNSDDLRHFNDEVQILLDLSHPNIIRLYELYKTPDYFFLVLEKLDGGELFYRISEKEAYSEMDARNVCESIFDAIAYCHDQHVAHRDLKPENLLLVSANDDWHVKVADFGFAKRVQRPNSLLTKCGSPGYVAPEVVNFQPYDERADNWSLGVIMYCMLGGYNPFQQETIHMTYQNIRQASYQFHPEFWDGISPDAKNLIRGFLTRDVDKRLTVQQALLHPWMTGHGGNELMLQTNKINVDQLKKFNAERLERAKNESVRSVSFYWLLTRR
jgi:calcium/calmodulin-dependent protein kinase I